MSEEETVEEKEDKPGKNKLMLILILVNTLALVGLGVYFVAFGGGGSQAATQEAAVAPVIHPKFGPLVEMKSIVANLNDENRRGFAKVTLRLEVHSEETKVVVEEGLVPIRNRLLIYLSNLSPNDTMGAEKKEAIRQKIKALIKEVLGGEFVKDVYFTEFVVQ